MPFGREGREEILTKTRSPLPDPWPVRRLADYYDRLRGRALDVREQEARTYPEGTPRAGVNERWVYKLWVEQQVPARGLETSLGERLEVVHPGWLRPGPGPDIEGAVLRLGEGGMVRGEVELHVTAGAWQEHGHHEDPAYNGVALHVYLWRGRSPEALRRQDGSALRGLELGPLLDPSLLQSWAAGEVALPPWPVDAKPGHCYEISRSWTEDQVGGFLDMAGDVRLHWHAQKYLEGLQRGLSAGELLYRGLVEALGYGSDRDTFRSLGEMLPLNRVESLAVGSGEADAVARLEALFLGVTGLLPPMNPIPAYFDEASRIYFEGLTRTWESELHLFHPLRITSARWERLRPRPTNSPFRRLAALARLLGREGASRRLESYLDTWLGALRGNPAGGGRRTAIRQIERSLGVPGVGYWKDRCVPGGRPMPRAAALLGPQRARDIVVNVVFPLTWAWADERGDQEVLEALRATYAEGPSLGKNRPVESMRFRLLGPAGPQPGASRGSRREQGLLQLYRDFCERARTGCHRCPLLGVLREFARDTA